MIIELEKLGLHNPTVEYLKTEDKGYIKYMKNLG